MQSEDKVGNYSALHSLSVACMTNLVRFMVSPLGRCGRGQSWRSRSKSTIDQQSLQGRVMKDMASEVFKWGDCRIGSFKIF
jgi:hypothetical protein